MTSDPAIGEDLTDLFNHLTGYGRPITYRRIVVAPQGMRPWILAQIAEETAAGDDGRITIKVNGLTDPEVIDALYSPRRRASRSTSSCGASAASGPACPDCPSGSPSARSSAASSSTPASTVSATRGERPVRYTIGSGDLMERNLDRRIEVLVPVLDPELQARLDETIELNLADDTNSWELGPDGDWVRVVPVLGLSAQQRLQELALERARRRRSPETLS